MTAVALPAPRHRPWSRMVGFASVYAKSIRDARLSFLIVLGLTAGLMLSVTSAIPSAFPTQEARDQMARLATDMGATAQGLAGKPVNDTQDVAERFAGGARSGWAKRPEGRYLGTAVTGRG